MEIVELKAEEGERLRSIRLRSLRDAPDAFGSTYEESVGRSTESWAAQVAKYPTFVAVAGNVDVGIVRGAPDDSCKSSAWLLSMWVDPLARGRGIGEALIDAVVGWARACGMSQLLLDVADDNAPAVALYARKGFERTGVTGTLPPPRGHIREHQRSLKLDNDG